MTSHTQWRRESGLCDARLNKLVFSTYNCSTLSVISESELTVDCKNEVIDTTLGSIRGEYPYAPPNSIEDSSSFSQLLVKVMVYFRKMATSMLSCNLAGKNVHVS